MVSVTNPYGRNLGFLDTSRNFFFQVAPQLYSRGWVDPVPVPLLLRNPVEPGIEPGPLELKSRTLTTIPQRRSLNIISGSKILYNIFHKLCFKREYYIDFILQNFAFLCNLFV
jgi:hypothetical protein